MCILAIKATTRFLVAEPEKFLSERSIERKLRQNVAIDSLDFPVSKGYLDSIEKEGGKIVAKSKWFNTCVVQFTDSVSVDRIKSLPFVDSVKYVWRGQVFDRFDWMRPRPRLQRIRCEDEPDFHNYFGFTEEQFKVHNAEEMIKAGFRGKGMHVGVVDAGFTNCDVIPYFEGINLFGYRDFVPGGNIFSANDHGTKVLSTMAVNQPNLMMGSAPEANYWLFRSEDSKTEFPVEEDFWVAAVEYADSVGVDLVNTSLGYNEFDDKTLSYSHLQLDGQTSLMTSAANKAFEKGMLVIGSAGNERKKHWRKITVPADAENLLAIGAIRIDSLIAPFSSTGPTADGRIKPDLVSVGSGTITIGSDGAIGMTNGTSLSSPFIPRPRNHFIFNHALNTLVNCGTRNAALLCHIAKRNAGILRNYLQNLFIQFINFPHRCEFIVQIVLKNSKFLSQIDILKISFPKKAHFVYKKTTIQGNLKTKSKN